MDYSVETTKVILLLTLLCIIQVKSFKIYQERIPNGGNVQHPCKPNYLWHGVGHRGSSGGGARNQFGVDFQNNDKMWNRTLCMKDSDNDGRTNGEELGDPDCVWSVGQVPKLTSGITHPGVCDEWGSQKCEEYNSWVQCDADEFVCETLKEPGVMNHTIRFPPTPVPAKETTYICMRVALPSDGDYHIIADEPLIDNEYVMHHMILYGCNDDITNDTEFNLGTPYPCNMGAGKGCKELIGGWSLGSPGSCGSQLAGFRIGENGYRYAALEMHWNNPEARSNYNDSSGIIIHYTPNLRPNDAGTLTIGQAYIEIPPGEEVTVTGTCDSNCSELMLTDSIFFTGGSNHMHYLGRAETVTHYRDGFKLRELTNDVEYSYDKPVDYGYEVPVEMKPGDKLMTKCTYKSTNRRTTTFYGDDTSAEMCYAFFNYYPRQNVKAQHTQCVSWKSLPMCQLSEANFDKFPEVRGCPLADVFSENSVTLGTAWLKAHKYCKPLHCVKECIPVIEEVMEHPCFKGEMGDFVRYSLLQYSATTIDLFARLDSCKAEMKECPQCKEPTKCPGTTDGATTLTGTCPLTVAMIMFIFISKYLN